MPLKINNLTQRYGANDALFQNFCAEFTENKIHAVIGRSGCGKTTLLNVIAGLIPYEGQVDAGNVSYVFQQDRLVQNITVKDNIALVLASQIRDKKQLNSEINKFLTLCEITQYANKYPQELSGGERKRVAVARAYAYKSQTLLLDEPFNSLDYGVKKRIAEQFAALNEQMPRTVIFVTHDADEALTLADDIYLLENKPATLLRVANLDEPQNKRDVYCEKYLKLKKEILEKL